MSLNTDLKRYHFLETIQEWINISDYKPVKGLVMFLYVPYEKFTDNGVLKTEIGPISRRYSRQGLFKLRTAKRLTEELHGSLDSKQAQQYYTKMKDQLIILPDLDEIAKEYSRLKKRTKQKSKDTVYISPKKGIYINTFSKDTAYPIKYGSKRYKFICVLLNYKNRACPISTIIDEIRYPNSSQVTKEKNAINNTFKSKTKSKHELIKHLDTGGYSLNFEEYNFRPII